MTTGADGRAYEAPTYDDFLRAVEERHARGETVVRIDVPVGFAMKMPGGREAAEPVSTILGYPARECDDLVPGECRIVAEKRQPACCVCMVNPGTMCEHRYHGLFIYHIDDETAHDGTTPVDLPLCDECAEVWRLNLATGEGVLRAIVLPSELKPGANGNIFLHNSPGRPPG